MKLRAELQWFAAEMEKTLCANDKKGGWHTSTAASLLARLIKKSGEIVVALEQGDEEDLIRECTDVANFAMMIADNVRAGRVSV